MTMGNRARVQKRQPAILRRDRSESGPRRMPPHVFPLRRKCCFPPKALPGFASRKGRRDREMEAQTDSFSLAQSHRSGKVEH